MTDNRKSAKIKIDQTNFDLNPGGLGISEPNKTRVVKVGMPCPECGTGILDYNGLLDLECPVCGFTEGPGGGCT